MPVAHYLRLLAFSLLLCASGQAQAPKHKPVTKKLFRDSLPKPTGYVNDYEHLFAKKEKKVLDSLLKDFEKRTTIQVAVVTFDSSMTTADGLDDLTLRIANYWGVGQKKKDNGVTIGISRAYRRMRIQNGFGIEKILTDMETKTIIDTAFIPGFRKGNYFEGTFNGLKALIAKLQVGRQ